MKFVIFGLTITSSWGNGHATLWRGLCRALHDRGHSIVFFEHDVPYYAQHRDFDSAPWCTVVLYESWSEVRGLAHRELSDADVAIVTSYCPDARAACPLVLDSRATRVFYDLDSPVTLARLAQHEDVNYLPSDGLGEFDLVLSYAGGDAVEGLKAVLGARKVAPLYGSVDPDVHRPVEPRPSLRNDLSYLGTYATDRQPSLEELFVAPARRLPQRRFLLAGSQYPAELAWPSNVCTLAHLGAADHSALFSSSGLTLNITRAAMASVGYCPSGRLFEAAACGAAIVTDTWRGLDTFFEPQQELLVVRSADDVAAALDLPEGRRRRLGMAARERALHCHTAAVRARELEDIIAVDLRSVAGAV